MKVQDCSLLDLQKLWNTISVKVVECLVRLSGHLMRNDSGDVSFENKDKLDLIAPAYHSHQIYITFEPCHVIPNRILNCVDSDEPVQPPFKLRGSKCCSLITLSRIVYFKRQTRLWSDCAYVQAGLSISGRTYHTCRGWFHLHAEIMIRMNWPTWFIIC